MNETASSLAITENRPARKPGGCVGIFFHLFEWNRKLLAKKKLFSRKLLPPARAKQPLQPSKRFGGDEKMPKTKLHFIEDESSGGFPRSISNANYGFEMTMEQKNEMHSPGLVARLMGLESVPAVNRDENKKGSNSGRSGVRGEKFIGSNDKGYCAENNSLETGIMKVESRPQKLQKTGRVDRHAVTRFGVEAMQIKNVLSKSRKHHSSKIVSSIKSPRISSSRNMCTSSRLIDAATRILEPGLQATNRARHSISYPRSVNFTFKDDTKTEEIRVLSPELKRQFQSDVSYDLRDKLNPNRNSCKHCGNLLEEQSFVCPMPGSGVTYASPNQESIKPRSLIHSSKREREVIIRRSEDRISFAARSQCGTQAHDEAIIDEKCLSREGSQEQLQFRNQQLWPRMNEQSISYSMQKAQIENEVVVRARECSMQSRRASQAVHVFNEANNFVASNKNLSGRTRPRVTTSKADNSLLDVQKKYCNVGDASMSQLRNPVRKRRTVSGNSQFGSNSLLARHRNLKHDVVGAKQSSVNGCSNSHMHFNAGSSSQEDHNRAHSSKANDAIPFMFSSSLRHSDSSHMERERLLKLGRNSCHKEKLVYDENGDRSLQHHLPCGEDALGLLLHQKLKKFNSQDENHSASGATSPKRSTAMILQELIFALTAEQPISPVGHAFKNEELMGGTSLSIHSDSDHPSPGSVLDANFSNDSCFTSSVDDSSGRRLLPDFMECSYEHPQLKIAEDLLDSANSTSGGSKSMSDLVNHICRILQSINLSGGGLMDGKLNHAKEVILNAELLFENTPKYSSDKMGSFLIGHFLPDELGTLAGAMHSSFNCILRLDKSKEGNRLGRFAFDCLVECLDLKYSHYSICGFKAWRRMFLPTNAAALIQEVVEEFQMWTSLAGLVPDEIIEWEMSHSMGKWTELEIEVFETGTELDWDILQILINEVVVDLYSAGKVAFEVTPARKEKPEKHRKLVL